MASKSQTMFNGVQSGRVGAIVGFKRNNTLEPQGIRPFVQPTNPKTPAQSSQRAKFAGAAKLASILSRISDHNIEGKKVGNTNRADYVKRLLAIPVVSAKGGTSVAVSPDNAAGLSANVAVPVSVGSLVAPAATFTYGADNIGFSNTAAALRYAGLELGDIVTLVKVFFAAGDTGKKYIVRAEYKQCVISEGPVSKNGVFVYAPASGAQVGQVQVFMEESVDQIENSMACAIIVERWSGTRHLLSDSFITINPISDAELDEINETFSNPEARGYANKFLYGADAGAYIRLTTSIFTDGAPSTGYSATVTPTKARPGDTVRLTAIAGVGNLSWGQWTVIPGNTAIGGQMQHTYTIPLDFVGDQLEFKASWINGLDG